MNRNRRVPQLKSTGFFVHIALMLLFGFIPPDAQAAPAATVPAEPPSLSVGKAELPARGQQTSILTVAEFGRYAITVKSDQGTGLQLVDHMTGPGEISGNAGEKDGRLDLFLEKGKYKIVTHGHEKASGSARLDVRPFSEKSAPNPPALVELKLIETTLKDFEQLSYWIEIKERRYVVLEAAGRSLADLRLWKDGAWLLDAAPALSTAQPRTGQPLRICRLTVELEPGLYLLSAYGGAPLAWAEDNGQYPLYLRSGIPELGTVTRKRFIVSPFGTDRFITPGGSTYFRLELAEAQPASLQAGWYNQRDSFADNGPLQSIAKNSALPTAEISASGNKDAKHIVTITAEAGTPCVFQQFEANYRYSFQGSGDYWISSVHSGHPRDSVDATAFLVSNRDTQRIRPLQSQTIDLDQKTGYSRRANLLAPLTLFLRINAKGPYQIVSQGVEARFVIEPFFTQRPSDYVRPASQAGGYTWELDEGYYVLTAEPVKKGIMDLIIRPASWVGWVWGKMDTDKERTNAPVRAAVRFPRVSLELDKGYTVYLNHQPEVKTGLVLRPLPVDLKDPLPITQMPGELVTVPIHVSESGTLRAEAEDGSFMELSLNSGPWRKSWAVDAGKHTVSIRTTSKDTVNYALLAEPRRLASATPLPALPDKLAAGLPDFPVLTESKPRFFDLERNSTSTFVIRADKPDLYHIQSTGLLATSGKLRGRTNPGITQESENGPGRNFFIQHYLREGDYQATVASKGLSRGHLGIEMTRTELIQGGYITSGTPARISLAAGKAIAYHFVITKPGDYRVRSFGLGRKLKCRLEDKDGWPIATPPLNADLSRRFEKGRYRLILLPESTDARVVTVIEPLPRPRRFTGKGPHTLPLSVAVDHVWLEPEAGQKRRPDQWQFELPAPGDTAVDLTGEMQADLVKINPDKTETRIAFIPPARGWKGLLQSGLYRIDAVSMRVNNRAPYQAAVRPHPLMAGQSRDISVPSVVPVSIGKAGLVELSSFGSVDVKARLMTEDGVLVAGNDDRPDDWNFQIVANLKPGRYQLSVEPVGAGQGGCRVSVHAPKEEEKGALVVPANAKIKLARAVQVFPVTLPAAGELLLLSARAPENVGLAIETADQGGWKTLGSASGRNARLEIPLRDPGAKPVNARYRLRLWSMDRRDTVAELSAAFVSLPLFSEEDLKKGIALSPLAGAAAAVVKIERNGLLQIPEEIRRLRWSVGPHRPCEQPDRFLPVRSGFLWIAGDMQSRQAEAPHARAARTGLGSGEDSAVQIRMPLHEKVTCDLAGSVGGPVVFLASSRIGRPAVELIEQGREEPVNIDNIIIGKHGALGIALNPKKPAARLWSASRVEEPFEARLTQISYSALEKNSARDSGRDGLTGSIEGLKARLLDLPKGRKRVKVSLGEGLAAALLKDERIAAILWAEGNAFTETIESDGDRVLLLHLRQGEDRFSVEQVPLTDAMSIAPLEISRSYENQLLNSGRLRLFIAPAKASGDTRRTLHVRGSVRDAIFTDHAGSASSGRDFTIDDQGGALVIDHGPGALISWLDRPGEEAVDLWASRDKPRASTITPPVALRLEGGMRAFAIDAGKPVMLHVRSATPLLAYLERGEKTPEVELYSQGVVLDAYLPRGAAELRLRALSNNSLSGQVDIYSTPVIPTGEGLGPEVLLAPGASRLFSFVVEQESVIGAGVKADSDSIDMEILNSSGQVMGKGAVQMVPVKPGSYLIKLQAPDSSGPVKARPALVGLKIPDSGPPADEIRKYLSPDQDMPLSWSSQYGGATKRAKRARTIEQGDEGRERGTANEEGIGEGENLREGTDEPASEPASGEAEPEQ